MEFSSPSQVECSTYLWGFPWVVDRWYTVVPKTQEFHFAGTAMGALLIGLLAPFLLNFIGKLMGRDAKWFQRRAINRYGNEILKLLHQATYRETSILITLTNRKVYIGWVASAPNLEPHDCFVAITPLFSGYQTDNLEIAYTAQYANRYVRGVDPSPMMVVLPISSIASANFFDHKMYPRFIVETPPPKVKLGFAQHDPTPAPSPMR